MTKNPWIVFRLEHKILKLKFFIFSFMEKMLIIQYHNMEKVLIIQFHIIKTSFILLFSYTYFAL